MDENRVCSILVLAVLCLSFRRVDAPLVEPLLTKLEHVPVREHLRYVAHEALGGQRVSPPKDVLPVLDLDTTV